VAVVVVMAVVVFVAVVGRDEGGVSRVGGAHSLDVRFCSNSPRRGRRGPAAASHPWHATHATAHATTHASHHVWKNIELERHQRLEIKSKAQKQYRLVTKKRRECTYDCACAHGHMEE
jgi:hypothetical protein